MNPDSDNLAKIVGNYVYYLFIDWFLSQKKAVTFSNCLKIIFIFLEKPEWKSHFSRWEREYFLSISCFETRTGIFFYQSRVSRREREIENDFSRSSGKKLSWFSREFPGTGIPVTLWAEGPFRYFGRRALLACALCRPELMQARRALEVQGLKTPQTPSLLSVRFSANPQFAAGGHKFDVSSGRR